MLLLHFFSEGVPLNLLHWDLRKPRECPGGACWVALTQAQAVGRRMSRPADGTHSLGGNNEGESVRESAPGSSIPQRTRGPCEAPGEDPDWQGVGWH